MRLTVGGERADLLGRAKSALPRGVASAGKIARTRLFEALGSDRYTWAGLNGLDRKVLPYLGDAPGVFLEIGANDGYSQSNTYRLERVLGWRGILVEPLPARYRSCVSLRRRSKCFNVACVGPDGPGVVELEDQNLTSVVLGLQSREDERRRLSTSLRLTVPASTLSRVIDEAGEAHIDFMSIDVEGAEFSVLAGLDLDRHVPSYLLIETKDPGLVASLFNGRMDMVEQLSYHDYLFSRT